MTGGDRLVGRFMRQDFFEFEPQFKLIVVGNNKPSLYGVDEAIRRRLHLIPFTVKIADEKKDNHFPEKLREEWPAILRWCLDGCLAWQQRGLDAPEAVRAASAAYLASQDSFGTWIAERCSLHPDAWSSSALLFESWSAWAKKAGETIGTQRALAERLEGRGFQGVRRASGRGYAGIEVLPWTEGGVAA